MALRMSLFLIAFYGSGMALAGQTPGSTPSVQSTDPPMAAKSTPPSDTLQPSLEILKQAIGTVKVEKWKASPAIRNEAESNAASIQRDLESTLPLLWQPRTPRPTLRQRCCLCSVMSTRSMT